MNISTNYRWKKFLVIYYLNIFFAYALGCTDYELSLLLNHFPISHPNPTFKVTKVTTITKKKIVG